MTREEIDTYLAENTDETYAAFQRKLIPTLPPEKIRGVRTPALRALAKRIAAEGGREEFLAALPHGSFEENQVHAFLIDTYRDYDDALSALTAFLPYADNWATCDQMALPALGRDLDRLDRDAARLLDDPRPYAVRIGIGLCLRYFLDAAFTGESLDRIAKIDREEYYVRMMCAWYLATALAKQYDAVIPYFENNSLPIWVHNKAIAKACESYRVSDEHKKYLKTLRRKES